LHYYHHLSNICQPALYIIEHHEELTTLSGGSPHPLPLAQIETTRLQPKPFINNAGSTCRQVKPSNLASAGLVWFGCRLAGQSKL